MCEIRFQNLRSISSTNKYIALKKSYKLSNQDSCCSSIQSLIEYFKAFFRLLDSLSKEFKSQNMFKRIKSKFQKDLERFIEIYRD
jgi:hypothetical protein